MQKTPSELKQEEVNVRIQRNRVLCADKYFNLVIKKKCNLHSK